MKPEEWYGAARRRASVRTRASTRIDPSGGRVVLADGREIRVRPRVHRDGMPPAPAVRRGCRPRQRLRPAHEGGRRCDQGGGARVRREGRRGRHELHRLRGRGVAAPARRRRDGGVPGRRVRSSACSATSSRGAMSAIHARHGVELLANERLGSLRGGGRVEEVVTESGRTHRVHVRRARPRRRAERRRPRGERDRGRQRRARRPRMPDVRGERLRRR